MVVGYIAIKWLIIVYTPVLIPRKPPQVPRTSLKSHKIPSQNPCLRSPGADDVLSALPGSTVRLRCRRTCEAAPMICREDVMLM